jgi:hypothetical protein
MTETLGSSPQHDDRLTKQNGAAFPGTAPSLSRPAGSREDRSKVNQSFCRARRKAVRDQLLR